MNAITKPAEGAALLEKVVVGGDLKDLTPSQRMTYYADVCKSIGLNPLTKPFEYITLNSKLTLYAKRDCTDQLRALKGISIQIASRELVGEIYVVTARATVGGREDESTGAVNVQGLRGEALANAYMKAETKAKRRVTLSIAGLGMLDESEVDADPDLPHVERPSIREPQAKKVEAKPERGASENLTATQVRIITRHLTDDDGVINAGWLKIVCEEFAVDRLEDIPGAKFNEVSACIAKLAKADQ